MKLKLKPGQLKEISGYDEHLSDLYQLRFSFFHCKKPQEVLNFLQEIIIGKENDLTNQNNNGDNYYEQIEHRKHRRPKTIH